jgi:hypothetical protein
MGTNRKPIGRPTRSRITPAAIAVFRRMEAARLKCTCPAAEGAERKGGREPDQSPLSSLVNSTSTVRHVEHPCAACDAWWEAHSQLHDELGLKPWQWPAFEYPDEANPYAAFSNAARDWTHRRAARPEAFALFRELRAAAAAAAKTGGK